MAPVLRWSECKLHVAVLSLANLEWYIPPTTQVQKHFYSRCTHGNKPVNFISESVVQLTHCFGVKVIIVIITDTNGVNIRDQEKRGQTETPSIAFGICEFLGRCSGN